MSFRPSSCLPLLLSLSLLAACATTPGPMRSAEEYYKSGEAAYAAKDYDEAIAEWKKVKETYSSPELTTRAELNIADAHFENKAYIEAAAAYENFRKLHPTNEHAQYALYRLALSHYYQIASIDTDQTPVRNAVVTMEGFLNLYPASLYAPEIKQKLADSRAKQLEYENYVGKFYLKTGKYQSAIKRFSEALDRFRGTPQLDETLFYLGKAYLEAGDRERGRAALQRLSKEYPESPLNKDAAKLM